MCRDKFLEETFGEESSARLGTNLSQAEESDPDSCDQKSTAVPVTRHEARWSCRPRVELREREFNFMCERLNELCSKSDTEVKRAAEGKKRKAQGTA